MSDENKALEKAKAEAAEAKEAAAKAAEEAAEAKEQAAQAVKDAEEAQAAAEQSKQEAATSKEEADKAKAEADEAKANAAESKADADKAKAEAAQAKADKATATADKKVAEVQTEASKHKEKYRELLGDGVTNEEQAEKLLALSGTKPPPHKKGVKPVEWAYMTYDGNVFFDEVAAGKWAFKLSGGVGTSKASNVFPVKIKR